MADKRESRSDGASVARGDGRRSRGVPRTHSTGHGGSLQSLRSLYCFRQLGPHCQVWEAESGRHIRTMIRHTRGIGAIAFSADGKMIASGGEDGQVLLWNAETGESMRELKGHINSINSLAFSPDGRFLLPDVLDVLRSFGTSRLAISSSVFGITTSVITRLPLAREANGSLLGVAVSSFG